MMRVDYETRDPIPPEIESLLWQALPEAVARWTSCSSPTTIKGSARRACCGA